MSVQIKKLNNFGWNERILMKFLGPVQLCASNFLGRGLRSAGLQGMALAEDGLLIVKHCFKSTFNL